MLDRQRNAIDSAHGFVRWRHEGTQPCRQRARVPARDAERLGQTRQVDGRRRHGDIQWLKPRRGANPNRPFEMSRKPKALPEDPKGLGRKRTLNPSDQRIGSASGIVLAMPTRRRPMSESPKDMEQRLYQGAWMLVNLNVAP